MSYRNVRHHVSTAVVELLLMAVTCVDVCYAQTSTWTGGAGDGQFTTAGNWSPGGVPGASSNVVNSIGGRIVLGVNSSPFQIASLSTGTTNTVNPSYGSLTVNNGAQLDVAGNVSVLSSDQIAAVGTNNQFTSVVSQFIQQAGILTVGSVPGDSARIYAGSDNTGSGSLVSNAGTINIADYGSSIYSDGTGSTVNLDPTNSTSTLVNNGNLYSQNLSTLNVDSSTVTNEAGGCIWAAGDYLDGGTFITGTTFNNAGEVYSTGNAPSLQGTNVPTILSINSTTVNNTGYIFSGNGTSTQVNDNATVSIVATNFNNVVDAKTGSSGSLFAGDGARLTVRTNNLDNTSGSIEASNGATGYYSGSTVNLNVAGNLTNGRGGNIDSYYGAQVTIDGGGTGSLANVGSIISGDAGYHSNSSLTIQNLVGALTNTGTVEALNGGDLQITGDLTQNAGLTKVDGNLTVTGTFMLDGGVLNGQHGTLTTTLVQSGGVYNPGEDPASFDLVGSYTQDIGGILQMDIASTNSFDTLNVSQNVILRGGTLNLDFLNGYVPTGGTSWQFITAGTGITGTFGKITSNIAGDDFLFNPNTGVVSLGGAPPVPESSSAACLVSLLIATALLASPRLRLSIPSK